MTISDVAKFSRDNDDELRMFQQVDCPIYIADQFVQSYRLDFLITYRNAKKLRMLCVEADGAEHHQGLLQREKDHLRDAHLASNSIHTIRFTGSQIYRDIPKCVDLIHAVLIGWGAKTIG